MASASENRDGHWDNDEEAQRQAAAFHYLLGEIGLAKSGEYHWFNARNHPELGDRTPTEAWLAGDHEGVKALVRRWYEGTRRAQRRIADDPKMMAFLRARMAEVDERNSGSKRSAASS